MASVREVSSFTEDLLCPICLGLFREPHILQCGHSFCAPCLEPCIPKGESSGLCPQCRHPFTLRHMNRALCSLAKKARLLKLDERAQLSGTGIWFFCEEHEEPLKLFCSQDEEPVCVICRDLPQHQGHNFLPIKNAVQTYQERLKASLEPLEEGLRRLKRSQCHQQENIIELKTCSKSLSDHISEEFMKMHQLLNDRELAIKQALENQREKNLAQMETKLKELDCKMASRSETLCRVQASLECKDHISFLKEAKELLERVRKEQGAPDELELDAELVGEDGLGASREDTDEWNETDEDVDEEEEEEEEDEVVAVDLNLGEFKGPLQYYAWKELLGAVHPVPARITLNCNSAHPSLGLVEEDTDVKFSLELRLWLKKPETFTYTPCVVGRNGITTGRFYWEIDVGDSTDWIVGMAKKSVKRKEELNFLPKEGVWAIELKAGEYQALSEPRTPLSVCGRMKKVGVYLDFEGGQLSFYNSSSMTHLYTFQVCFRRLQLVQNTAARVIMGATRRSHVTPLLRELHWLPVVFRVRFKVLVATFKALHGLGPRYLRDRLLPPIASHRPLRSHRKGLLQVASARQCRLTTPRGRAFSVGASNLWNELPSKIRRIPNLRSFRRALKTLLFQQAGLA